MVKGGRETRVEERSESGLSSAPDLAGFAEGVVDPPKVLKLRQVIDIYQALPPQSSITPLKREGV